MPEPVSFSNGLPSKQLYQTLYNLRKMMWWKIAARNTLLSMENVHGQNPGLLTPNNIQVMLRI
jgi:hypothetical protein